MGDFAVGELAQRWSVSQDMWIEDEIVGVKAQQGTVSFAAKTQKPRPVISTSQLAYMALRPKTKKPSGSKRNVSHDNVRRRSQDRPSGRGQGKPSSWWRRHDQEVKSKLTKPDPSLWHRVQYDFDGDEERVPPASMTTADAIADARATKGEIITVEDSQ